eukprot:8107120-Lingulodinium_polyedra.AAC.1
MVEKTAPELASGPGAIASGSILPISCDGRPAGPVSQSQLRTCHPINWSCATCVSRNYAERAVK